MARANLAREPGIVSGNSLDRSDVQRLRIFRKINNAFVRARPTLVGCQYILPLTSHAQETVHVDVI
jgi:hypothetical protein